MRAGPSASLGRTPAKNRMLGSPNLGAVSGIQNFLSNTGQRGADYLRSLGIMPTYNGVPLDQSASMPYQTSWTTPGGFSRGVKTATGDVTGGGAPAMLRAAAGTTSSPAFGVPGAGGLNRGILPLAGLGGLGGKGGFGLEDQIGSAYSNVIGRGGSPFSDAERARMVNLAGDPIARGTQDAIEAARQDAVRRGDTSGSTLGDVEARIRQRGAAELGRAQFGAETGLRQQALQNLLASLGGAGGYVNDRRQAELLLGQLEGQGGQLGQGINLLLGM